MAEVLLGGLLTVVATFIFNYVLSKREENMRWDSKRLEAITSARISSMRAAGKIEAMAMGLIPVSKEKTRPAEIELALDSAWYALEELRVLFPKVEPLAEELQSVLLQRLDVAFETLLEKENPTEFFRERGQSGKIAKIQEEILTQCRSRLKIR